MNQFISIYSFSFFVTKCYILCKVLKLQHARRLTDLNAALYVNEVMGTS